MKIVMWGQTNPATPAPIQMTPKTRWSHRCLATRGGADDLEQTDGDEEPAGQIDDGVHAGVAVADHEESEDHGQDAPDEVPAPHLLELRAHRIADGNIVVGELIGHGHDFPLGE